MIDRTKVTFEQAEGRAPLPSQLRIGEVSPMLRSLLWKLVYDHMCDDSASFDDWLGDLWTVILTDLHVWHEHRPVDEFDNRLSSHVSALKKRMFQGDYVAVLGFFQFVIRHPGCSHNFKDKIAATLRIARAAYSLVDDTIVPFASDEERQTVERAFGDLHGSEFNGARTHLAKAAEELTGGQYADSVRESVHAVESTARLLVPTARSLGVALAKLEAAGQIHGSLKAGFNSIYGFTSDEQGIRHALLDAPAASVDEHDALFMLGACAAFVSYLIGKARIAGLIA